MWSGNIPLLAGFVERYCVSSVEIFELTLREPAAEMGTTLHSWCQSGASRRHGGHSPVAIMLMQLDPDAAVSALFRADPAALQNITNDHFPSTLAPASGAVFQALARERPELFNHHEHETTHRKVRTIEGLGLGRRDSTHNTNFPPFKDPVAIVQVVTPALTGLLSPQADTDLQSMAATARAFFERVQGTLAMMALFPAWAQDHGSEAASRSSYPSKFTVNFQSLGETTWDRRQDQPFNSIYQSKCFTTQSDTGARYRCVALLNADLPPIQLGETTRKELYGGNHHAHTADAPFLMLCRARGASILPTKLSKTNASALKSLATTGIIDMDSLMPSNRSLSVAASPARDRSIAPSACPVSALIPFTISMIDVRNLETKPRPNRQPNPTQPSEMPIVSQIFAQYADSIDLSNSSIGSSIPLSRYLPAPTQNFSQQNNSQQQPSQLSQCCVTSQVESNTQSQPVGTRPPTSSGVDVQNILIIIDEHPDNAPHSRDDAEGVCQTLRSVVECATKALHDLVGANYDVCIISQERLKLLGGGKGNRIVSQPLQLYGPHIASSLAKIIHSSRNSDFTQKAWGILSEVSSLAGDLLPKQQHCCPSSQSSSGASQALASGMDNLECAPVPQYGVRHSFTAKATKAAKCPPTQSETEAAILNLFVSAANVCSKNIKK